MLELVNSDLGYKLVVLDPGRGWKTVGESKGRGGQGG